jgi:single-stranded DNA-specific DHH superfamily exonuclease
MVDFLKDSAEKFNSFICNSKRAVVFFDDDPDGVCSGCLLIKLLESKGIHVSKKLHFDDNAKPFSKEFNTKLEGIDLLVFTDFNITGFGYFDDYKKFILENPSIKVLIIDHHVDPNNYLSENVLYLNVAQLQKEVVGGQYCCSKFTWDLVNILNLELAKELKWISIIGVIGDHCAETWKDFIQKEIDLENSNNSEDIITPEEQEDYYLTPYGKCSNLIFYGIAKDKKEVSKIMDNLLVSKNVYALQKNLKIYELIQKDVYDYLENYDYFEKNSGVQIKPLSVFEIEIKSEYDIGSIVANRISSKNPEIIFFVSKELSNGFIHISCRHQDGLINVGDLMSKAAEPFEGANGGGHKCAAGAVVPKQHCLDFKKKFYDLVKEMQDGLL